MMQPRTYVSDRKRKRRRIRKYLFVFLTIVAVYVVFWSFQWFLFRSPLFRVTNVVVEGNSAVSSADIISLVQSAALQKHNTFPALLTFNNMLLWPGQVPQSDLNMVPQLASLSVSKDHFSHTVTIHVTERIPFGIWCYATSGNCYWFDNSGIIFQRALPTQGNVIYVVEDSSQTARGLNQKVLSDEFVNNFISIVDVLRQAGIGVRDIDLTDIALEEVDVKTTNGPDIYFSLQFPADDYLSYIQKLMGGPGFSKLQYIDCRTQDRIYYK